MPTCSVDPRARGSPLQSWWGGWFLLLLFLQSACTTGTPSAFAHASSLAPPHALKTRAAFMTEPGLRGATEYTVDFLEPGTAFTRPVPVPKAEFQRAFLRLAQEVQWTHMTPRQAARELLRLLPESHEASTVEAWGEWTLEQYGGQGYGLLPEHQEGPVALTPLAEHALQEKYLHWCEPRGGGDCLGLMDDGALLRTEDRRTLALALAFGPVLDETCAALGRELNARALVSLVVWTVALYCMMWMVPEPTTKAVAATLTVMLMGWLGLQTVYGLMDGWAQMATAAQEATTFEELRAAGEEFGKTLGEDAARAMILAVSTLAGRTLGEVAARVKSLPGYSLAQARWGAQGGATVLGRVDAAELALASEGSLAQAVSAVEAVATSPQGPLAVVMLKRGQGGGAAKAPGGRSCRTVLRHRGGNQQVELSDGQRWHLPRGKSVTDIPVQDKVGDRLQEAVTQAAREWGPGQLSDPEADAINTAIKKGKYWLARLLEREARGRFVQVKVQRQFKYLYEFSLSQGVDIVDSATGTRHEILSGTDSNLARHGRRMSGEFFRMLTF